MVTEVANLKESMLILEKLRDNVRTMDVTIWEPMIAVHDYLTVHDWTAGRVPTKLIEASIAISVARGDRFTTDAKGKGAAFRVVERALEWLYDAA